MRHIRRCNLLLRLYICLFCIHVCADGYLRLTSSMRAFIYLHARSYFPASSSTYRYTCMYGRFEDPQPDRCVLRVYECRQLIVVRARTHSKAHRRRTRQKLPASIASHRSRVENRPTSETIEAGRIAETCGKEWKKEKSGGERR